MQVKIISDGDFLAFNTLWCTMYSEMPNSAPAPVATRALSEAICDYKDFLAVGCYEDETLIGFICGWGLSDGDFYCSGLYSPYPKYIRPMVNEAERLLKESGYNTWTAHTDSPKVASIYEKLGAKLITTKHKKEF